MNLYGLAKSSYENFQHQVEQKLAEYADQYAKKIMEDENSLKRLSKIGEILKTYPELNSLLSNSSSSEVLKALNELK